MFQAIPSFFLYVILDIWSLVLMLIIWQEEELVEVVFSPSPFVLMQTRLVGRNHAVRRRQKGGLAIHIGRFIEDSWRIYREGLEGGDQQYIFGKLTKSVTLELFSLIKLKNLVIK